MDISDRILAFARLGEAMKSLPPAEKFTLFQRASNENAWFTESSLEQAWQGISYLLDEPKLRRLMARYPPCSTCKTVGVTMAGNIPLVGFHDFMCVLLAGHCIWLKPSASDRVLILAVIELLKQIEPAFADRIRVVERLNGVAAAIATGSNNTARYFEYYFRSIPHLIRKNRTSCAVLSGDETPDDLVALGNDVFSYYGLGCRNVSTLFVPTNYNFKPLLDVWQKFSTVAKHHKYANNLDYQKAIMLVNCTAFLDGGHVLLRESEQFVSPISVVHYRVFQNEQHLQDLLIQAHDQIQITLTANGNLWGSKPFGTAQLPEPEDFADSVDTMAFLTAL